MPILLIDVFRAIWALRRDPGFLSLAALTFILVVGGSVFYWRVEDLGPLDAVYLSVITLTTVGYGDVAPATAAGKVFTCAFLIIGMGILVGFVTTIAAHIRKHSVLRGPFARTAAHDHRRRPPRSPAELQTVERLPSPGDYDVLVIGSNDASRRTALEAARLGLRVVIVESEQNTEQTEQDAA